MCSQLRFQHPLLGAGKHSSGAPGNNAKKVLGRRKMLPGVLWEVYTLCVFSSFLERVPSVTPGQILGARNSRGRWGQLKVCQSPRRGRSQGHDWQSGERGGLEAEWREKALGRREVLPSCWRGVSCFPRGARVKLSESLALTDRRHPRARARQGQEPASCAAPLGRRGPPRALPASRPPPGWRAAPHLARASARTAGAGSREGAARRRSRGSGRRRPLRSGLGL